MLAQVKDASIHDTHDRVNGRAGDAAAETNNRSWRGRGPYQHKHRFRISAYRDGQEHIDAEVSRRLFEQVVQQ